MTEQTFIELGKPNVSELRPGDIVKMRSRHPNAVPFEAEAWEDLHVNELNAGLTVLRFDTDEPSTFYEVDVVSVKRPFSPLPTKPGALVFPYAPRKYAAYTLNKTARWWSVLGESQIAAPEFVARALAEGTHYVAFEGVEVDG